MEKENKGNVYTKITTFFTDHPHATVTVITLCAFVAIGVVIYLAPQFGASQNSDPTSNSLKFNLPSEPSQDQGAVQGASTQSNGPEEQSSSQTPQSPVVSEAPSIAASDSATPTATPAPTSSPTSAPTATPAPTSAPTETPAPTSTPAPSETPTVAPTISE